MSEHAPIYQLEQVRHIYGERTILSLPHLSIAPGDILALVGPSGAGKSTLLRLLNFLELPTHGSITFQGHRVDARHGVPRSLKRQVTMVFQRPALLSTTVLKNAAFGLRLRGVKDAEEQAMHALEAIGLGALAHKQALTLSGGEMQRVALVRATLLQPTVLLLDEPTANLDPYNITLIEESVQRQHVAQGTTIVLVTHNIFQARRLATRVALLLDGTLVEIADTHHFFDAPTDERTAAFLRGDLIY